MTERFVWLGAVVLFAVPMAVIGHTASGKMTPVDDERLIVAHAPLESTDERYASAPHEVASDQPDEAIHDETAGLPWWMQMLREGPASVAWGGVELVGAVLTAFSEMPAQLMELAEALPELSGAIADNPALLPMFGIAMLGQIANDARTVATTTKRAEAMRILGAVVADRISPGKFLGFVKKSRQMQRVARTARKAGSAARAALSKVGVSRLSLCFVAGTLVHGIDGYRPIETLELGDRVATTDLALAPSDDPDETWRQVSIEMARGPNDTVEIELLRSPEWIARTGARAGRSIRLSIPEMGLDGNARMTDVRTSKHLQAGRGHLVLATFKSRARDVVELRFEGSTEMIAATSRHRLLSLDANDFVAAGDLRVGERLQGRNGVIVVASVTKKRGEHTVYNIEVDTDHSYFVGRVGVLSHNNDPYVYSGLPAGRRLPGVPVGHALIDGDVRFLSLDDFRIARTISAHPTGDILLLRDPSDRTFVFREVVDSVEALARTEVYTFLSRSAGLATAPTMPAMYRNRLGVLQELAAEATTVRRMTFRSLVEPTASFGDVRVLDYVAGFEQRTYGSIRLLEIEPKTYAIIPLAGQALFWTSRRLEADVMLPSSISDRVYEALRTLEHQRDSLRRRLDPYASQMKADALVDETIRAAKLVVAEIEKQAIFVVPHASPYVAIHPAMMISRSDFSAFRQTVERNAAFVRGPASQIPFPGLTPGQARILRGMTPTEQLSAPAMAAYREQLQLAYRALWTKQPVDPSQFRFGKEYADASERHALAGHGLEIRSLLRTRASVQQHFGVDIGHPYDDSRYEVLARQRPASSAGDEALGSMSIRQLTPGSDLLGKIRQRAFAGWVRGHRWW